MSRRPPVHSVSTVEKRPLTVRVARWSATHPWRAMGLWTLFVVLCFVAGNAAGLHQSTNNNGIGEAGRADRIYQQAHYNDPATENVLVTARSGALGPEGTAAATDAANRMKARPDVTKVDGPVPAANGRALMVVVTMAGDPDTATDRVQALRDVTSQVQS